jgi:flavodoxin
MKIALYIIVLVAVAAGAGVAAHLYRANSRNDKEMAEFAGDATAMTNELGKTLVVYYSMTGRTRDIAQRIAQMTRAQTYEITTAEKMPSAPKLHLVVRKQLKSGQYPVLAGSAPDLSDYDTIFVGGPVWWYHAATPLLAFLEKTDFKGKRVVPFSTQGSNVGDFAQDVANNARNAELVPGAAFNNMDGKYSQAVDNKIATWLNTLPGVHKNN